MFTNKGGFFQKMGVMASKKTAMSRFLGWGGILNEIKGTLMVLGMKGDSVEASEVIEYFQN